MMNILLCKLKVCDKVVNKFKASMQSSFLHHHFLFRRKTRRYSNESGCDVYGRRVNGYDDIPTNDRDKLTVGDRVGIPHYVKNWNKHNPPYISSPTLLTGNATANEIDNGQRLPFRERSLSVGNKEIQCHDIDLISATSTAGEKIACDYKTHVVWHENNGEFKKKWN